MKKNVIRITESELKQIVAESVQTILREYVDSDYAYNAIFSHMIDDINNGLYDDKLDNLMNVDWVCDNLDVKTDRDWDDVMWVIDAAKERKCIVDKDFAFKNGEDSSNVQNKYPSAQWAEGGGNMNRFNIKRDSLSDYYWNEHEYADRLKKFPNTFTKKGKMRKDAKANIYKDLYGTNQYNKRPLHRKDSANRNLMDM